MEMCYMYTMTSYNRGETYINTPLGKKRLDVEYSDEWPNMPWFMRKKKQVYPLTIRQEARLLKAAWADMRRQEKSTPIIQRAPAKEIVTVRERVVTVKEPGISITRIIVYIPVKIIVGVKKVCIHIIKRICGF